MPSFMQNRLMLQNRLLLILEVVKGLGQVDARRVAAVGFCFGGFCALDLARAGADVRGVASFHGVLKPLGNAGNKIKAKVIVFHGWKDPFAPPEDLVALDRELSEADADWQIHAYGKTMHSFMAASANNPRAGVMYNEVSARRALASLKMFLPEVLA